MNESDPKLILHSNARAQGQKKALLGFHIADHTKEQNQMHLIFFELRSTRLIFNSNAKYIKLHTLITRLPVIELNRINSFCLIRCVDV